LLVTEIAMTSLTANLIETELRPAPGAQFRSRTRSRQQLHDQLLTAQAARRCQRVMRAVNVFTGQSVPADDQTVLVSRVEPNRGAQATPAADDPPQI
jgi:hypothetical protein